MGGSPNLFTALPVDTVENRPHVLAGAPKQGPPPLAFLSTPSARSSGMVLRVSREGTRSGSALATAGEPGHPGRPPLEADLE